MSTYFAAALAWLRASTNTLTREQIYGVAVVVIGGSGIVSGVDGRIEAALITTVTAATVLVLAAINSRPLMALVYVLLGSITGLGQIVAVVYDGAGWAVWVGYGAGLAGTVLAFFRVPTRTASTLPQIVHIDPANYTAIATTALDDVTDGLELAVQKGLPWDSSYADPLSDLAHAAGSAIARHRATYRG
ncbi:hypothetical protein OG579_17170 [Williamsia herbipolensis]|uniref:Uncharacterized protein n=1 Tax=Williamsia herbipolensis TaxID=1603258 RepID=A0AAU4K036_9NOCA|nr:hypothetical protein [Williamsia herbipolensis]